MEKEMLKKEARKPFRLLGTAPLTRNYLGSKAIAPEVCLFMRYGLWFFS
jgi:hypothetical protein